MSRCSVTDIFNEIIIVSFNVKGKNLEDKISNCRSDLENKFRQFLKCLYESVLLEKCDKFDVTNIGKQNQEAYAEFKETLATLSSDISYEKFANWINIKGIADFYRITENEIAEQRLQIEFYKKCKSIMWKFLKATNHIKNPQQVTRNLLNSDKIYEHIKTELEMHEKGSSNLIKIDGLKKKHSEILEKLKKIEKKKKDDEERKEQDGEKVQIAKLYYLEKEILRCICEDEKEYDEYYRYFEEHSEKMKKGIIRAGETVAVIRYELAKWLIVETNIEMDDYLDKNEQDFVLRCRGEFVKKKDKLLEEIIREKSKEMREEVSAFWDLEQEVLLKREQLEKERREKIRKINQFYGKDKIEK